MDILCNKCVMQNIDDELAEKVSEYKTRINELEEKLKTASDNEKKEYDFELADLKSKLNLAESELHKV